MTAAFTGSAASAGGATGTVGYLTSQYPATSHTFIRREIAALRGAGLAIRTYSIRPGEEAKDPDEARSTFTVLRQSLPAFLAAHVAASLRHPLRYLRTLRLALRHRVPGLKALIWALLHFGEAILLARQLRRDGVTQLHNHFANSAATVGLLASDFEGLPWSLTLHGISEFDYPAGLLLADKLERARFAACVSYFGMAQAMRLTRPAIWPRLTLVRCGIDPADLPCAEPPADIRAPLEIICVGRLSPEKGHAGLIAVMDELLADRPNARLKLVGDGPERAALEQLVDDAGLAGRIVFLGSLGEAETLALVARSHILVLTSFMEGLPVVLIEALALGVPVVASRVAGIPELVEDGETGLLFDPGNWADLRGALERMVDDADLRERLGENGRAHSLEQFGYPAAAYPLIPLLTESMRA